MKTGFACQGIDVETNYTGAIKANLTYLHQIAKSLPRDYEILAGSVLSDPRFQSSPGSSGHHHAYLGGLLQHTTEVVENVVHLSGARNGTLQYFDELLLAAIWHDYHKIYEYAAETRGDEDVILKLEYRVRVGHVAGSFAEFYHQAKLTGLTDQAINLIGHIMLAHHGRLEWRSPVEPQTPEAFILHAADMLSARPS
jgi:3'-5' exoribonuclease